MAVRAAVVAALVSGACGGGGGFPDAPPIDHPPPGGRFSATWTVTDTSGNPVACDQISAQSVTASIHNHDVEGGETQVFVCGTGMGTSQDVLPGVYDMTFELGGTFGTIATAPPQDGIVIESGQTTPIAPLAFMVDAQGALALHVATGKPGGNCAPAAMMGAGITTMTITLEHASSSACEPVTLNIAAGATQPARTYTVDCTNPQVGACIESDQEITATGVPADTYVIHIRGNVTGGATCWKNDDQFPVPPNGMTLTRTLNLGFSTGAPGC